jgi:hypothetical protein
MGYNTVKKLGGNIKEDGKAVMIAIRITRREKNNSL